MAITYTTTDGTAITTLADLSNHLMRRLGHANGVIVNAEVVVQADLKPGTPRS